MQNLVYDFVLPVGVYDGYMRYLRTYSQEGSERLRVDGALLRVTRNDILSFGGTVAATFRGADVDVLTLVGRGAVRVSNLAPLVEDELRKAI